MKQMSMSVLITLVIAGLAYLIFGFTMQRRILYPRPPASPTTPTLPKGVSVVWLGPDSDVEAWYLPPPATARPAPAMIFTHGNGELIDHWVDVFSVPQHWGMGILLVEYPGYGRSGGEPSESSIRRVVISGFDHLIARPEIDADRVVAYGRSLGGGAAGWLARERPIAAMILESAFTSVRAIAAGFGIPGPMVLDRFETIEAVSRFERPVLVIHGAHDRIIPAVHARKLAEAAQTEARLLPCGHNDCPRPWPLIQSFLLEHDLLDSIGDGS
ncbi:MAG: prolyl oligopeptidase family serine peptidase [Deltaproteobacteria bacterium]|nr:prolyl oligopeptidase family serine peptidase [Deltaproteobacteria bacterium]